MRNMIFASILAMSAIASADNSNCPHCNGKEGFWDTLLIPDKVGGHTCTVHMPNPAEFRAYLERRGQAG